MDLHGRTVYRHEDLIGSKIAVIVDDKEIYFSPAQYDLWIREKGIAYDKFLESLFFQTCTEAEFNSTCKELTGRSDQIQGLSSDFSSASALKP
jgi:hypothetical protein